MTGRMSDAVANAILDGLFGSGSPATYYIGLSTTLPTNTGTNVTEPSGGSYARVAVTNNVGNFPAAVTRAKANGAAFSFPTASGSWGTVQWFILMSASTSGTFFGWGPLAGPATIVSGQAVQFAIGDLDLASSGV